MNFERFVENERPFMRLSGDRNGTESVLFVLFGATFSLNTLLRLIPGTAIQSLSLFEIFESSFGRKLVSARRQVSGTIPSMDVISSFD